MISLEVGQYEEVFSQVVDYSQELGGKRELMERFPQSTSSVSDDVSASVLAQAEGDGEEAEAARHDLALLGFGSADRPSADEIRDRFLESRAWRWLEARLLGAPGREMYFGELSARLHDLLLDDPRPYRKEVKNLVSNLLDWAVGVAPARAVLNRPAHSQRFRLLS